MSRSGSSSGKGQKILALQQLHLTPHYIYMINQTEDFSTAEFSLKMSKDNIKISQTKQISYIQPTKLIKCPALEFSKVRFVFNVKALFEEEQAVKIQFQLFCQNNFSEQKELEEFEINLLHYSYQHSREWTVMHKQNSIGRMRKYVLNYSFAAIYGEGFDENMIFQKIKESLIEEEFKLKSTSKLSEQDNAAGFQILVKEPLKEKEGNTLALVEAVVDTGVEGMVGLSLPGMGDKTGWEEALPGKSYFSSSQKRQNELIQKRQVPRSVLVVDQYNPLVQSTLTCRTESLIAAEIKQQGNIFGTWLILLISIFLIYFLMHPVKKI